MTMLFSLLLVILAGVINGSFALPTKHMNRWQTENIWLNFSFWGFLLIPWISMWFISHDVFKIFCAIDSRILWIMIAGGMLFGLGQICFAFALRFLGLGLAFVINIGLGTAGSALLPLLLWHPETLGTRYSYAIMTGVIVFVAGVVAGAIAGKARDEAQHKNPQQSNQTHSKLWLVAGLGLGVLAGVGSICQALTYIYVNPIISQLASSMFNAPEFAAFNIAWLGIFTAAFVPYMLYFFILNIKNKSLSNFASQGTGKYWVYTFIMGFFFWMSLVFFSKASQLLGGDLAPVIAWPMFMVFIVLTSNFWGWYSNEWAGCGRRAATTMLCSIGLLIVAVGVFAYANSIH